MENMNIFKSFIILSQISTYEFRNKLFMLTTIIFLFDLFLFWEEWLVKHEKQEGEFADNKRQTHAWKLKLHVTTNFVKLFTFFRLFVKTYLTFPI